MITEKTQPHTIHLTRGDATASVKARIETVDGGTRRWGVILYAPYQSIRTHRGDEPEGLARFLDSASAALDVPDEELEEFHTKLESSIRQLTNNFSI